MQNEDETNVPTGDDLFEQPAELAGDDDALGSPRPKTSSGLDAQRKRTVADPKRSGAHDAQGRRN
jgi:hypothetical protein